MGINVSQILDKTIMGINVSQILDKNNGNWCLPNIK